MSKVTRMRDAQKWYPKPCHPWPACASKLPAGACVSVRVCVCVCMCACACVRLYMRARRRRPSGCGCSPIYHTYVIDMIYLCMHACTHTYINTCINTYVHTYILAYIHTYTHTYIHTYIHTHIHTHTHTHRRVATGSLTHSAMNVHRGLCGLAETAHAVGAGEAGHCQSAPVIRRCCRLPGRSGCGEGFRQAGARQPRPGCVRE